MSGGRDNCTEGVQFVSVGECGILFVLCTD